MGCRDCNLALRCRRRQEVEDGDYPGLAEYCDISPTHTMCQFSPGSVSERCGAVVTHRMTGQIRERLLAQHNRLRGVVARGEQEDQPAAANMMASHDLPERSGKGTVTASFLTTANEVG